MEALCCTLRPAGALHGAGGLRRQPEHGGRHRHCCGAGRQRTGKHAGSGRHHGAAAAAGWPGEADSGSRYAHYEFRIPAEQYSTFLAAADGAGNVTQKSESVQDVTAQYVDVEARLASLEAQRESLNAMLAQAQDVETLLAVQRELADVQYEIESYTAQKRTYDDQIAYSTVQVTVHEVRRVTENPQSFASRLGAAFRSGWYGLGQGVQSLAVGLAAVLPTLLVLAVVGGAVWAAGRTLLRRRHKKPRAPGPAAQNRPEGTPPVAPPEPKKTEQGTEPPHGA